MAPVAGKPRSRKPFQPAVGSEFPVDQAPVIEARTRGFLARFFALAAAAAVVGTAGYGMWSGNYRALGVVWDIAGPIIGAIVAYYFGAPRKDTA